MSKEFTKKAVEMLLKGATLLGDPCPYCKGVRIMKEGNAFCVNCGREGKDKKISQGTDKSQEKTKSSASDTLDQKLEELTNQLNQEKDHTKQQQILGLINDIITLKEKLKKI